MELGRRHQITIHPRRVLQVLTATALAFALGNLAIQLVRYRFGGLVPTNILHLFDLNREANFPTLFAVALLALAAALLFAIAATTRRLARPYATHWYVLAALFGCLAVDEFVQLHELGSSLLARALGVSDVRSYFLWVVPAALVLLGVGAAFLRFLIHLPRQLRQRLLLAAGIFVGGALGLETVAAIHAVFFGISNLPHSLIFTAEELLEMLGVIVLIWTLLHYAQELGGTYDLQIVVAAPPDRADEEAG